MKKKLATEKGRVAELKTKKKCQREKVSQSPPRQNRGDSIIEAIVLVFVQEYTFLGFAHM